MGAHHKDSLSQHIHKFAFSKKRQNPVDAEQKVKNFARCVFSGSFANLRLVAAAALAAALVAAGGVSVVVEVGDDDRVGGARPRDAVAHRHQNNLHAAVERVEVRLPKDRRQWVATQRLAHQAAQLFRSVVEPRTFSYTQKLDYG